MSSFQTFNRIAMLRAQLDALDDVDARLGDYLPDEEIGAPAIYLDAYGWVTSAEQLLDQLVPLLRTATFDDEADQAEAEKLYSWAEDLQKGRVDEAELGHVVDTLHERTRQTLFQLENKALGLSPAA